LASPSTESRPPAEQVSRPRGAAPGYRGSVLEVDDDGDGVRIVLE
jgi:hypothetical protein